MVRANYMLSTAVMLKCSEPCITLRLQFHPVVRKTTDDLPTVNTIEHEFLWLSTDEVL